MDDLLLTTQVVANIGILTFVIASMAALGSSLTIGQIVGPLRNGRLLATVPLVSFVLVPALAFLLKLVQVARGAVALSVGVMVLLMVITIGYVPLMLPLLLPGVQVNPLDIATSLVVLMLIPLALGHGTAQCFGGAGCCRQQFRRPQCACHVHGWRSF
jgi:BASS family bile acid:Na+ symporter